MDDPLRVEREAFWGELSRALAILGVIVALAEIAAWVLIYVSEV